MSEPQTPEEWQAAVNAAEFALCLDSAIQYGLLKHVPINKDGKPSWCHFKDSGVNIDRCIEILERGKKLGFEPLPIEQLLK